MSRKFIALSVFALVLFAACATTTAPAGINGTVTKLDGNAVTIQPAAGGEAVTVNVSRGTDLRWYNGIEAGRSELIVGHRVSVWVNDGTQNASKLVIEQ
ncbi:MAG: hypothetical protein ACLGH0_10565 [Thermoanaerobaculia bacterium]